MAGAAVLPRAAAHAQTGAAPLALLVAGPAGEQISRWGDACALALAPGFPGGPMIVPGPVGGLDGVTGANQLDALVEPDGKTAVILPGAALLAWLTGEQRVHFDPVRWVPVMAGCGSGVFVLRNGLAGGVAQLRAMAPLRLAVDGLQSNDLAALVGLARFGVKTAPVFGLHGRAAKVQAFQAGDVDAVFVCGEGVPEDVSVLAASGGVPVFCLGALQADGGWLPDPLFAGLPTLAAFGGGTLTGATKAAVVAATVDFLVVLPRLTDPGDVSLWRAAAFQAVAAPALQAAGEASAITLQLAPQAGAILQALNLVSADQAGLQAYLAKTFGWQPG
jgi:hypothetical protein